MKPVSLGLLIDNSGSMRSRRTTVEAAALAFARASNPDDELFVLNFADKPRIDVPFTSDVRVLEAGIARAAAIGGTAMHDAVDAAEEYLAAHAAAIATCCSSSPTERTTPVRSRSSRSSSKLRNTTSSSMQLDC